MTSNDIKRNIKRAAEFRRVSTENQVGDVKSALRDQHRDIGEMAGKEGWEIVAEYEEPGVSGALTLAERPEIRRLMADAHAGLFDVVVFWDNKRMGRNGREVIDLADDLRKLGILVAFTNPYAVADYYDDNDQLLFMLNSHMSERDLRYMKTLHARGRYGSALEGRWIGGFAPLGYEVDPKTKMLVVHEGEAAVVRRMFELVASGLSARETTNILNKEFAHLRKDGTLPARRGAKGYGNQHVYDAIKRDAYYGAGFKREVRSHPDAAPETIVTPAPAIVSEELWLQASAAIGARRTTSAEWATFDSHPYAFGDGRVQHVHPDGQEFGAYGISRERTSKSAPPWMSRSYRCAASVPRRGRYGPDDPDRCPGFGVTVKNRRSTSINADATEAAFLVSMLTKLKDADTFNEWLQVEDARLVADATAAGFVARTPEEVIKEADAAIAELDKEIQVINRQERKLNISEAEADTERAEVERKKAKLADIKVRAAQEMNREQILDTTIESLFSGPIGYDLLHPGQEREVFIDSSDQAYGDIEVVEAPGWTDVAEWLYAEAEKVLSGAQRELNRKAVEWAGRLAEVFDITIRIHDVGADLPRITAKGRVDLGAITKGANTNRRIGSDMASVEFGLVLQDVAA